MQDFSKSLFHPRRAEGEIHYGKYRLAKTNNADAEKAKSERAAEEAKKVQAEAEKQKEIALESLDATVAIAQIADKKRVRLSREEQEKLAKNAIAVEQLVARECAVKAKERELDQREMALEKRERGLKKLYNDIAQKTVEIKQMLMGTIGKRQQLRLLASVLANSIVEWYDTLMYRIFPDFVDPNKQDKFVSQREFTRGQIRESAAIDVGIPESELLDTADIGTELAKLRDDDPADRSKNRFESTYDHDDFSHDIER